MAEKLNEFEIGLVYDHGIVKERYVFDSKMFCPNCGGRGIWICSEGDYYVGEDHNCKSCGFQFNLPCSRTLEAAKKYNELQQIQKFEELPETPEH